MIKTVRTGPDGRTLIIIGLSFGNLKHFRDKPGDTFIKIEGKEMGLPIDVVIFSGETEAHCTETISDLIGPGTSTKGTH